MPAPPLVGAVESAVGVASVGEAVVVVSLFEEVFLTDSRFPLLLGGSDNSSLDDDSRRSKSGIATIKDICSLLIKLCAIDVNSLLL